MTDEREALPEPYMTPANGLPLFHDIQLRSYGDARAKAAREMAMEEAARLCEWRAHAIDSGGNAYLRSRDALDCALAIRAMSTPGKRNG